MKIFYIITIPWGWIKQRPHFLAEHLSTYAYVDVFYKKAFKVPKANLITPFPVNYPNLKLKQYIVVPFSRIPFFRKMKLEFVNRWLLSLQTPDLTKYDYVWITSPYIYKLLKRKIKEARVIYDCMDDLVEFGGDTMEESIRLKILQEEKALIQRADIVVCSAEYLRHKILSRAGMLNKKAIVVNNAIEMPEYKTIDNIDYSEVEDKINILSKISNNHIYIGTISSWFDFDTIIYAVNNNTTLHFTLIGPSSVSIPKHDRIHYLGTVERKYIFRIMSFATSLIMPFKVNELIKSVNPVKLYEYIYTGKPVIASRYGETEKFKDYVSLYSSSEEFLSIINKIDITEFDEAYQYSCIEFVKKNTWKERCLQIMDYLQK